EVTRTVPRNSKTRYWSGFHCVFNIRKVTSGKTQNLAMVTHRGGSSPPSGTNILMYLGILPSLGKISVKSVGVSFGVSWVCYAGLYVNCDKPLDGLSLVSGCEVGIANRHSNGFVAHQFLHCPQVNTSHDQP